MLSHLDPRARTERILQRKDILVTLIEVKTRNKLTKANYAHKPPKTGTSTSLGCGLDVDGKVCHGPDPDPGVRATTMVVPVAQSPRQQVQERQ